MQERLKNEEPRYDKKAHESFYIRYSDANSLRLYPNQEIITTQQAQQNQQNKLIR